MIARRAGRVELKAPDGTEYLICEDAISGTSEKEVIGVLTMFLHAKGFEPIALGKEDRVNAISMVLDIAAERQTMTIQKLT